MNQRNKLKKKQNLSEKEESDLIKTESMIADACEDENRNKVMDNFKNVNGNNGNLSHQGVWKLKKKYFPKIKPSLPVGKKNLKNQLPILKSSRNYVLKLLNLDLDKDLPNQIF